MENQSQIRLERGKDARLALPNPRPADCYIASDTGPPNVISSPGNERSTIDILHRESLSDIQRLLRRNCAVLERVTSRTRSNRSLNPSLNVPESVLNLEREADSVSREQPSVISGTEFDFDDAVVNSRAYRRTMMIAEQSISQHQRGSTPVEVRIVNPASNDGKISNYNNDDHNEHGAGSAQGIDTLPLESPAAGQRHLCLNTKRNSSNQVSDYTIFAGSLCSEFQGLNTPSKSPLPPTQVSSPAATLSQRRVPIDRDSSMEQSHSIYEKPGFLDSNVPGHATSKDTPLLDVLQTGAQEKPVLPAYNLGRPFEIPDHDCSLVRNSATSSYSATQASTLQFAHQRDIFQRSLLQDVESAGNAALPSQTDSICSPMSYQHSPRTGAHKSDSGFYSNSEDSVYISKATDDDPVDHGFFKQTRLGLTDSSPKEPISENMEILLQRLSGMTQLPDVRNDPRALSTIWKEIFLRQSSNLLDLADLIGDFGGLLNIESYNGRGALIQKERELFKGIRRLDDLSIAFRSELEPFRQARPFDCAE